MSELAEHISEENSEPVHTQIADELLGFILAANTEEDLNRLMDRAIQDFKDGRMSGPQYSVTMQGVEFAMIQLKASQMDRKSTINGTRNSTRRSLGRRILSRSKH